MAIASLPLGIPPNLFYYRETISSTEEDWDLETKLLAAGWDGIQRVDAYITINNNVLVGSSSLSAAMTFEDVVPDDSLIVLENHGRIYGIGGQGGDGGSASKGSSTIQISPAQGGGNGGRALWVRTPLVLWNFSRIYGGGGGGAGGGAAGFKSDQGGKVYGFAGGGGGGGEGYQKGSNRGNRGNNSTDFGDIPGGFTRATHGQNGTTTSSGNGGKGGYSNYAEDSVYGGDAGNGGRFGSSGQDGKKGESSNPRDPFDAVQWKEGGGGSKGNAGQAINGKSFITYKATGDIKGAQVN